jgi:hypothetical protein
VVALTTDAGRQPPGPKPPGENWARGDWPDAVEVSLTALGDAAAARLTREEDWDQGGLPPERQSPVFRQNERTFRARVALPREAGR